MIKQISLHTLNEYRARGEKFTCLTAYDATFAQAFSDAGIDVLLVGDSLGMVLHGHKNTLNVSMSEMIYHTRCVAKGNRGSLIIADMPFMSYKTESEALDNAATLLQAGAHVVKLEGGSHHLISHTVKALTAWGIPVCAHVGLTPQWINQYGGFHVQGRSEAQAERIANDADELTQAGAVLLLLECIPTALATRITQASTVPVIGIGAGASTDGQVLVMHDALGIVTHKRPRHVKNFMQGHSSIEGAIKSYIRAVKDGSFPDAEHEFSE
jgi:3-methyl-2-oxobutanoate hydroxymethyltransferase